MNSNSIYIAYVLDTNDIGTQLLRYAFEHPTIEYWLEENEQTALRAYFTEHHYSHQEPIMVEPSNILEYMPFH